MGFRTLIAHPALGQLYDYWLGQRAGRRAPLRRDIDPIAMPKLLPDLIIAERAGADDLRYRLVGTRIVRAHGLDYTGWLLSELATQRDAHALARQLYAPVLERALPVYSEGPFRWPGGEFRWTRRLHLPMSTTGERIDQALVGQMFDARASDDAASLVRAATPRGDRGGRGRGDAYLRCGWARYSADCISSSRETVRWNSKDPSPAG